jgi:hypothetical protein
VVERSPEKAGVGGSTPSLATIIPKNLAAQSLNLPPAIPPTILSEQVDFVPHQLFQESPLRLPHRLHVRLCLELHSRPEVLVAQYPLHRLGLHFQLHQRSRKCMREVVKAW